MGQNSTTTMHATIQPLHLHLKESPEIHNLKAVKLNLFGSLTTTDSMIFQWKTRWLHYGPKQHYHHACHYFTPTYTSNSFSRNPGFAYCKLNLEDCTWNPGIYYTQKSRSIIIYIRESDVISSTGEYLHVGTPNDRSTATGPVTRYRHFALMSFSSDQVASQWSLEDGTAFRGVRGVCLRGLLVFSARPAASQNFLFYT